MIKKWFIILCGIVLIVGLGIRYEENLKDQLLNRVFQRLGLTAEYYRLRFVPLELELRNFSITPSKNVTIAGSRTYINVKWWPFLFREVRVRRLIIENPRIQVAADVSKQKKILTFSVIHKSPKTIGRSFRRTFPSVSSTLGRPWNKFP